MQALKQIECSVYG